MTRTAHRALVAALLAWSAMAANGNGGTTGRDGTQAASVMTGSRDATATSAATGGGAAAAAPATAGDGTGQAKELFISGTTPSCSTCHALRDAGATGNIGPDLDELRPDAARVAHAVKNGFENMPPFGHVLSEAQIQALSRYVEQAAAGK